MNELKYVQRSQKSIRYSQFKPSTLLFSTLLLWPVMDADADAPTDLKICMEGKEKYFISAGIAKDRSSHPG